MQLLGLLLCQGSGAQLVVTTQCYKTQPIMRQCDNNPVENKKGFSCDVKNADELKRMSTNMNIF